MTTWTATGYGHTVTGTDKAALCLELHGYGGGPSGWYYSDGSGAKDWASSNLCLSYASDGYTLHTYTFSEVVDPPTGGASAALNSDMVAAELTIFGAFLVAGCAVMGLKWVYRLLVEPIA